MELVMPSMGFNRRLWETSLAVNVDILSGAVCPTVSVHTFLGRSCRNMLPLAAMFPHTLLDRSLHALPLPCLMSGFVSEIAVHSGCYQSLSMPRKLGG